MTGLGSARPASVSREYERSGIDEIVRLDAMQKISEFEYRPFFGNTGCPKVTNFVRTDFEIPAECRVMQSCYTAGDQNS